MDGYKCFNGEFMNRYGIKFEANKVYTCDGLIQFRSNGFHFCKRLEDTLRFCKGMEEEIVICKVKVLGNICWYDDLYNDYYDMGCTDKIYIGSPLVRDSIIKYADRLIAERFIRFIQGFRLNKEELDYFKMKYSNNIRVMNFIKYYQEGDLDVFYRSCGIVRRKSL